VQDCTPRLPPQRTRDSDELGTIRFVSVSISVRSRKRCHRRADYSHGLGDLIPTVTEQAPSVADIGDKIHPSELATVNLG
jgi:hypothetical protein